MVRPTPEEIGHAMRSAYTAAGIRQKDIAKACDVDQTTVSAWVKGEYWPPLWALPIIDELCGRPRGHILRLAGYIDDDAIDVEAAVNADDTLTDPDREALLFFYRFFRSRAQAEAKVSTVGTSTTR